MKIEEQYSVHCCKRTICFDTKYKALEWLLRHIRQKHKQLYITLEKRAMRSARSQNGNGYWDKHGEGWKKARATFRWVWIRHEVEEYVNATHK